MINLAKSIEITYIKFIILKYLLPHKHRGHRGATEHLFCEIFCESDGCGFDSYSRE